MDGTVPAATVNSRVKREPPPMLETGRKDRRSTASGGSKLAAHGLWQPKKKQHHNGDLKIKKPKSVKKKAVMKMDDDEDMLADGSGSGDGPVIPLPPAVDTGDVNVRSEFLLISC